MRKAIIIIAAMLTLFGERAMAQRCLPGMSAVEIKTDMADGFYTGKSRDCGYDFGVFYSVFTGSHGNTWSFGGEYLQTFKPYGEKGRIPVAQFTGEAGYNHHILSDYSMTFHLYGGISALGGYETVNWGKSVLSDGSTLHDGDNFIYGGALTLQADFYLSDKIALTANVKGRFTFGSDVQIYHTTYGIGVKFIIG